MNLYLGELEERWKAHCAALGVKPGARIRRLIEGELGATPPPCGGFAAADESPDLGARRRVEVRLTPTEYDAVQSVAAGRVQSWVVGCIRAQLTGAPYIDADAANALGESNYQLLAIGRNLNQIARHLNTAVPESLTLDQVNALVAEVRTHTAQVSRLLGVGSERWRIVRG